MLEKANPYLIELEKLYEKYSDEKKIFRKKNAAKIDELKNPFILQAIRATITSYEESNFLGKLWISLKSLFSVVGYHKNLIQYYDLNDLIQKIRSDLLEKPENTRSFDEMTAFLQKFDAEESIKNTMSNICRELLEIRANFKKNPLSEIFSVVPLVESKSVSPPDKAPESLEDVQYHDNAIAVKNMICAQSDVMDVLKEQNKKQHQRLAKQAGELGDLQEKSELQFDHLGEQLRKMAELERKMELAKKQKREGGIKLNLQPVVKVEEQETGSFSPRFLGSVKSQLSDQEAEGVQSARVQNGTQVPHKSERTHGV